jgi:LicD family
MASLFPSKSLLCVTDTRYSQEKELFPLRDSFFEGIHVKIPFDYAWLLEEEYGKKALTVQIFEQ